MAGNIFSFLDETGNMVVSGANTYAQNNSAQSVAVPAGVYTLVQQPTGTTTTTNYFVPLVVMIIVAILVFIVMQQRRRR